MSNDSPPHSSIMQSSFNTNGTTADRSNRAMAAPLEVGLPSYYEAQIMGALDYYSVTFDCSDNPSESCDCGDVFCPFWDANITAVMEPESPPPPVTLSAHDCGTNTSNALPRACDSPLCFFSDGLNPSVPEPTLPRDEEQHSSISDQTKSTPKLTSDDKISGENGKANEETVHRGGCALPGRSTDYSWGTTEKVPPNNAPPHNHAAGATQTDNVERPTWEYNPLWYNAMSPLVELDSYPKGDTGRLSGELGVLTESDGWEEIEWLLRQGELSRGYLVEPCSLRHVTGSCDVVGSF